MGFERTRLLQCHYVAACDLSNMTKLDRILDETRDTHEIYVFGYPGAC